ncbi:MAG: S24/S26 family peptidase [Phocaeicola sp.]|uniref:S24/S26 family peptidase n=1 Tax=Phocaeicola TaxID=909656 RepID=UPI00234E50CD|nr:S24/S26 family peptidase [Phocaeicola oris]MCE2615638.1 S24/S26 family peptidase [Phocaeicola oris]
MDEIKINKLIFPNAILLGETERLLDEGRKVTILVKGNSMLPFITGDKDSVELEKYLEYQIGDIVLARIAEGQYVLHRVIFIEGNQPDAKVVLMGDGNIRGMEQCYRKHIIGRVNKIIKKNKEINPNTPEERKKARLWKRLLPVRRWILAIYKRI